MIKKLLDENEKLKRKIKLLEQINKSLNELLYEDNDVKPVELPRKSEKRKEEEEKADLEWIKQKEKEKADLEWIKQKDAEWEKFRAEMTVACKQEITPKPIRCVASEICGIRHFGPGGGL